MQYSNIIQSKPLSIIAIIISLFLATIASHAYGDTFRIIDTLIAFIGALLLEIIIFAIIHFMYNQKNGKALFSALLLFLLALWIHDKAIVIIFILFVIPLNYLTYVFRSSTQFLFSIFLFILIGYSILLLNMRYTPGSVSLHSFLTCHIGPNIIENYKDGQFAYIKTRNNVCITRYYCNIFKDHFHCSDAKSDELFMSGIVPTNNINPQNFHVERFKICDKKTYLHYWIVDMNDKSYFMTLDKGNGRFFEIDKSSFRYLGNDLYQDKYGYVYKNTRVH